MSRKKTTITSSPIISAEKVAGLTFTPAERRLMVENVNEQARFYRQMRRAKLENAVAPALRFVPDAPKTTPTVQRAPIALNHIPIPTVPDNLEDLAFYPVTQLARLMKARKISSMQLTEMYLARLRRYDPQLQCVITLTEDLALEQARQADADIAAGRYRGPLHGIPWGVKDLLATRRYRTTWGATPFKHQWIDTDATVIERLTDAGAVLVAKLTVGELAWGDVWYGGKTKTPWNVKEGSSGSSAGSGAATAAGLVGFAIGTETWGSIVSPSTECGLSGLRPTFGRVSRHGAMALSWSMDKIGPMCRSVEDCALVFNAIYGPDGRDPTVADAAFKWKPSLDVSKLRIGYVPRLFAKKRKYAKHDEQTLVTLRALGVELIPIELPAVPLNALQIILRAEAAAAFDELTRSGRDDLLVRQIKNAWPNLFRYSRLIPAVEYIQANRIRAQLMHAMTALMETVEVYLAPSYSDNLLLTNLTGHPAVVVPNGFKANGVPTSITFTGRLYDEATVLAVTKAYQDATDFHLKHPPLKT